jgi:hypothetical protein
VLGEAAVVVASASVAAAVLDTAGRVHEAEGCSVAPSAKPSAAERTGRGVRLLCHDDLTRQPTAAMFGCGRRLTLGQ